MRKRRLSGNRRRRRRLGSRLYLFLRKHNSIRYEQIESNRVQENGIGMVFFDLIVTHRETRHTVRGTPVSVIDDIVEFRDDFHMVFRNKRRRFNPNTNVIYINI